MKINLPQKFSLLAAVFVATTLVCAPVFAVNKGKSSPTSDQLDSMFDEFDQMDKQDFKTAIDKANDCTRARNFSCSESELAKAKKTANSGQDKKILALAHQNMANEKTRIVEEEQQREKARQRVEQLEREAEDREERQAIEEKKKRREQEEREWAENVEEPSALDVLTARQDKFFLNERQKYTDLVIEGYRKRDEQVARERAESNERAAEQRRDAQRDRNARVAQADTDRQQSQQRQQADQDRAREQESNRQRQAKEKADQLAAQEAVRVAEVAGTMDAPDKKGCFVPVRQPECVVAEGRWAKGTSGQYLVRVTNNCRARVYVTLSHQKKDGTWSGSADGIGAGRSHTFDAYAAAGRYEYVYTGSTNWQNDWICGDKERDPVHAEELKRHRSLGKR